MLKKIQAIYFSEILPIPKYAHFREGKKGMLNFSNGLILDELIMSGDST